METVTVSPKFQVVIPRRVRESLDIRPGQKVQVIRYEDRIELIPVRPVRETRGFLEGIDTEVDRVGTLSIRRGGWSTSSTGLTQFSLPRA
jgi:AbrB family looped-hinge helix DNA binding protein